jgi:2,4-dienoyl-CoA reductase-like NADH-dependent reductase (Old Yellow Enzyme family)
MKETTNMTSTVLNRDTANLDVGSTLRLRNKQLKNRIAKGALSEGMATLGRGRITPGLINLYKAWGQGGLGLCITGNVMVDVRAKNEPGNVVIENETDMPALQRWAAIGKQHDMAMVVQLSHPGKQCPKGLNKETVAPSPVGFGPELAALFGVPRELTELEILGIIRRFGESARICEKAGFDGIQLHGAHGYLISQFLSPLHNQRQDKWGGSLANRVRFAMACYEEVRRQTGPDFIVGIKLNSADFQKGGFGEDEAIQVFKALDAAGIDFIEISGGTYESAAMTGITIPKKESTIKREAYFLEFAEKVRQEIKTVLMVSGGFRTRAGMDAALRSGACDLVGVARPLIVEPDAPSRLLAGHNVRYAIKPIESSIKMLDKVGGTEMLWYGRQMKEVGKGKLPNPELSANWVLFTYMFANLKKTLQGRLRLRA